jgi:hypothetical protein
LPQKTLWLILFLTFNFIHLWYFIMIVSHLIRKKWFERCMWIYKIIILTWVQCTEGFLIPPLLGEKRYIRCEKLLLMLTPSHSCNHCQKIHISHSPGKLWKFPKLLWEAPIPEYSGPNWKVWSSVGRLWLNSKE